MRASTPSAERRSKMPATFGSDRGCPARGRSRAGPGERDRLLVEHGGAAAGEALDRLEAVIARRGRGLRVAGARDVLLSERDHRARAGEPDRLRKLAARDAFEDRARDGGVVGGAVGEGVRDQLGHLDLTLACPCGDRNRQADARRDADSSPSATADHADLRRDVRRRRLRCPGHLFLRAPCTGTEIRSYGDALFWTSAQLLTVSSQLKNPISTGARVLDIFFEIWAITVVADAGRLLRQLLHPQDHARRPASSRGRRRGSDQPTTAGRSAALKKSRSGASRAPAAPPR